MLPGSHRGPILDHHQEDVFVGAWRGEAILEKERNGRGCGAVIGPQRTATLPGGGIAPSWQAGARMAERSRG
jgi:hypothetical protein